MVLSLRLVIAAVCAMAVAVVATVTLSLCLTSSLAALRALGKDHAAVLLRVALTQSEGLFNLQADAVDALVNHSASYDYPWPSDNATVFSNLGEVHVAAFMQSQRRLAIFVSYYRDNTRFYVAPETNTTYAAVHLTADPVSEVGFSSNTSVRQTVISYYQFYDNRRLDVHRTAAFPPATETALWRTLTTATGQGQIAVYAGIFPVDYQGIQLLLACSAPLYPPGTNRTLGNIRGFVLANLNIPQVSDFLRSVRGTPGSVAAAIDNAGYLLGSSEEQTDPFVTTTEVAANAPAPNEGCRSTEATAGGTVTELTSFQMVCRTHGTEYAVKPVAAAAVDEELSSTDQAAIKLASVDGAVYFMAAARVQLRYRGMQVRLLLAMPEADVIGDVVRARNLAVGATVAVFVIATGSVFAAIAVLLRPLDLVAVRLQKAARLEDDEAVGGPVSSMAEVRHLEEAYLEMNAELNRLRGFVPQAVLLQGQPGTAGADDDDDEDDLSTTRGNQVDVARGGSSAASDGGSTPPASASSSSKPVVVVPTHRTATTLGVKGQTVTVLVANGVGFLAGMSTADRAVVLGHFAATSEVVARTVREQGGVLDSLHGDHYVATFNAASVCGSHARHGCVAGLRLSTSGTVLGKGMRCGVATGRALVGNVGGPQAKAFSTLGAVYGEAMVLERMTRVYDCAVLAAQRTCVDAASWVNVAHMDVAEFEAGRREVIGAVLGEIGGRDDAAEGEWLYVVGADPAGGASESSVERQRLRIHNAGFEAASKGALCVAPGGLIPVPFEHGVLRKAAQRLVAVQEYVDQHGGIDGYVCEGAHGFYATSVRAPRG